MKNLIYITLFIIFCSCQKNDSPVKAIDETYVSFNIIYEDSDDSEISAKLASNRSIANIESQIEQISYISLEDNNIVEVSLLNESKASFSKSRIIQGNIGSIDGLKAVQSPIPTGIQYRIVVYNQSGDYVIEKLYKVGSENTDLLFLPQNSTYTFIFLSYNRTDIAPPVVGSGALSSKTISSISGDYDLMYTKVVASLVQGSNVLNAVFNHKFAKITVVLDATDFSSGDFSNVNTPTINPHSSTVSLNLSSGNLTYSTPSTNKSLTSSTSTTRKLTYTALVATQSTSSGSVTFGSVTFNGKTSPLTASGLNIYPGERYTLTLKLRATHEAGGLIWAPANLDYNSNTGVYSFAPDQYTPGRYFSYYRMLPVDQVTFENNPVGDPCNEMGSVNSQTWRLPTEYEMKAFNNNLNFGPIHNGNIQQINGVRGVLFSSGLFLGLFGVGIIDRSDITSTSPSYTDIGENGYYILEHHNSFPNNRYGSFFVFNSERSTTNVSIYPTSEPTASHSQLRYGHQIRCVRSL